jgi:hypothetical protein
VTRALKQYRQFYIPAFRCQARITCFRGLTLSLTLSLSSSRIDAANAPSVILSAITAEQRKQFISPSRDAPKGPVMTGARGSARETLQYTTQIYNLLKDSGFTIESFVFIALQRVTGDLSAESHSFINATCFC